MIKSVQFIIAIYESFFILVAAELTISFLFSEVFEYMNTRAEGRWYVIKPWQWGIDFTNWIYYLSYGIFTYSVLLINYLKCWFYPIAAIICVLLLFGVAMLLPWNRKSINYLISCEMAIKQHYKILAVWLRGYRDDNIIHNYLTLKHGL